MKKVRPLRRRWADRSRPIIAASRGGGSKLNRRLSGLFKIFLSSFSSSSIFIQIPISYVFVSCYFVSNANQLQVK